VFLQPGYNTRNMKWMTAVTMSHLFAYFKRLQTDHTAKMYGEESNTSIANLQNMEQANDVVDSHSDLSAYFLYGLGPRETLMLLS